MDIIAIAVALLIINAGAAAYTEIINSQHRNEIRKTAAAASIIILAILIAIAMARIRETPEKFIETMKQSQEKREAGTRK